MALLFLPYPTARCRRDSPGGRSIPPYNRGNLTQPKIPPHFWEYLLRRARQVSGVHICAKREETVAVIAHSPPDTGPTRTVPQQGSPHKLGGRAGKCTGKRSFPSSHIASVTNAFPASDFQLPVLQILLSIKKVHHSMST